MLQTAVLGFWDVCNIKDGALCEIVNGWKSLVIVIMSSIVKIESVLDPHFQFFASKMESFVNFFNRFKLLTIATMSSNLNIARVLDMPLNAPFAIAIHL